MGDGAGAARAQRETAARAAPARPPVVVPSDADHPLLDLQEAVGNRVSTGLVQIVAYEHATGAATGYLSEGGTVPVQVLTNRFAPGSYTVTPGEAPKRDAGADFVRWSGGAFEWRQAVATFRPGGSVTVVVEPDPAAAFARLPAHIRAYMMRGVTGRPSGAELARLVAEGEQLVRDGITEADLAQTYDPTAAIVIEDKLADIDLVEAMRRAGWSNFPSREEFFRRLAVDVAQTSDFRRWWDDEATARAWWAEFPEDAARDWDTWGEQVYQKAKRAEEASWLEAFRRIDAAFNVGEAIGWVTVLVAGGFLGGEAVAAGRTVAPRLAAAGRVLKDVPAAVEAASGVRFSLWMKALTASGLSANFVNSLINRAQEGSAAGSNPLSIVAAALVDAPAVGKLYEAVTDESLLTGEDLNRSAAERWSAGLTGGAETALNMLGIRDLFGGGTPRPPTPRGTAADPEPLAVAAEGPTTPAPAAEPVPAPTATPTPVPATPVLEPVPTPEPAATADPAPAVRSAPTAGEPAPAAAGEAVQPVAAAEPAPANAAPAGPSRGTGPARPVPRGPGQSWFSRHILNAVTRAVLETVPPTRGVPGADFQPGPALAEVAEAGTPARAASVAETPDVPPAAPAATPAAAPTSTPAAAPAPAAARAPGVSTLPAATRAPGVSPLPAAGAVATALSGPNGEQRAVPGVPAPASVQESPTIVAASTRGRLRAGSAYKVDPSFNPATEKGGISPTKVRSAIDALLKVPNVDPNLDRPGVEFMAGGARLQETVALGSGVKQDIPLRTGGTANLPVNRFALTLTDSAGAKQVVSVEVVVLLEKNLPAGVHGTESGPARMVVNHSSSGYSARIYIARQVDSSEITDIVGHELDELSGLVHGRFTGADLVREQQAGLDLPTAASGSYRQTVHDRATIRELTSAARLGDPRLWDKAVDWGLTDRRDIEARMALLRAAGVDPQLVRRIEDQARLNRAFAELWRFTAARGSKSVAAPIDPAFVRHMMYPEPSGTTALIGGAHLNSAFTAHVRANPNQIRVLLAGPETYRGVAYRCYGHLEWKGPLPVPTRGHPDYPVVIPPGNPGYPGLTVRNRALWSGVDSRGIGNSIKTTFSNLDGFLAALDDAYRAAKAVTPKGTPVPNGTYQTATGPPIVMYFDPTTGRLESAFVAETFF